MHEIDPLVAELRVLRRLRKLRAVDVAEEAGVDVSSISLWENGHKAPIIYHLRAYANACGYDLALIPRESS